MIPHTVYRTFGTAGRRQFIRITGDVAGAVRESAIELSPDPGDYRPMVIKVLGE